MTGVKTNLIDDLIFDRAYECEQLLIVALGLYDDLAKREDGQQAPVWKYRDRIASALEQIREVVNLD